VNENNNENIPTHKNEGMGCLNAQLPLIIISLTTKLNWMKRRDAQGREERIDFS